jgi:replication-associated recombination protein RarA
MLKITLHDSARELRFKLEGRLSGPWVDELRNCWQTAASTTAGRKTVVDLDEIDFVGPEGESLLAEMHDQNVRLVAATPVTKALVEEIRRRARCARVEEKPSQSSDVFHRHTLGSDSRAS